MSSLDLQTLFRDRPPGTAGVLQHFQQRRQVVVGCRQPTNHSHHPSMLALLHRNSSRLFSRRCVGRLERRAGTLRFQPVATRAVWRSIKNRSCKKPHILLLTPVSNVSPGPGSNPREPAVQVRRSHIKRCSAPRSADRSAYRWRTSMHTTSLSSRTNRRPFAIAGAWRVVSITVARPSS